MKFKYVIIVLSAVLCLCSCGKSKESGNDGIDNTSEPQSVKDLDEKTKEDSKKTNDVSKVTVPDVIGCDEDTAKTALLNTGLIPTIDKEYSDEVEPGLVSSTSIEKGKEVDKNSKITVHISKGSSSLACNNCNFSWTNSNPNWKDRWTCNTVYIMEGELHISMTANIIEPVTWKEANASVDGVNVIKCDNSCKGCFIKSDELQSIELCIKLEELELSDLGISSINVYLPWDGVANAGVINLKFNFTWM